MNASRGARTAYRAAWVLPVAAPPIADGVVVVRDATIEWVGAGTDAPAGDVRRVDLGDAVLAPGLVNAHTHLDLTAMRGLLDGTSFFDWIRDLVAARAQLSDDDTRASAALGAIESLEHGVTTVADTAPTDASAIAMDRFGLRGIAYLEVFGPDPADAADALAGVRARIAALRARVGPRVTVGVSPHAPYSVSDALFRAVATFAHDAGIPLATHVAESAAESALVERGEGPFAAFLAGRGIAVRPRARSPIALLGTQGVLGGNALLIHVVRCDAADVAAVASAGAAIATCPTSNRHFAHGAAPVAAFRAAGVRVGIGTDSAASGDTLSPADELRVEPGASGGDAWRALTLDGATALGLGAIVGSLEAGKRADLVAYPEASRATPPSAPPRRAPRLVVVDGVERVRDGVVTAPDTEAVRAACAEAAARLRKWRAARTRT